MPEEAISSPSPARDSGSADIVSQAEIESLLMQVGAGDSPAAGAPAAVASDLEPALAQPRYPQFSAFSAADLRCLRLRHEELIRRAGIQIASLLRLECSMQMSKLETVPLQTFTHGMSDPTYLSLFKLPPLRGIGLLEVPLRLGLCLVDRLLGGPGRRADNPRSLSDIEQRLIARVVDALLAEICGYWSSFIDLSVGILGRESSARFLQIAPPSTMMLVVGISPSINGESLEEIQIAFPRQMLEPLLEKLVMVGAEEAASTAAAAEEWNPAFAGLKLPMTVEFPPIQTTAQVLAHLQPGDFLPLGEKAGQELIVRLAGKMKFSAELGTAAGKWAARIRGQNRN